VGVSVGVGVTSPVGPEVGVASVASAVGVLVLVVVVVGNGVFGERKGVPVGVDVKVGKGVAVSPGREVETPATGPRPKSARRQACKKASRPIKPALRINCLLSILL
jgi:hypothetical protein